MENIVIQYVEPGLLTDTDYDNYSSAWRTLIDNAILKSPGLDLTHLFYDANDHYISSLSFTIGKILHLISTPGASFLKVRFILVPDTDSAKDPHFSAVMFAADSLKDHPYHGDGRLSAYYLATPYWGDKSQAAQPRLSARTTADIALPAGAADVSGDVSDQNATVLPHDLAKIWLTNWQNDAQTITPELFTASNQTALLGYNFALKDFIEALMLSQPMYNEQDIRLIFGVRQHFSPSNLSSLTNTFGVAARLYNNESGELTSAEPFFDLATPCPPTH